MNQVYTVYSVLFLATALVSFFVAFLAWQRRLVSAALELQLLMLASGVGAAFLIFETSATTLVDKVFWSKLEYLGGVITPVLYLIFVLRFTGKVKFLSAKYLLMMFIVPICVLILAFTNEHHELIWTGFTAISPETNLMEYYHGPGFWFGYIFYSYLMLFLSIVILIYFIIHQNKPFSSQAWIILIGGLFPWIVSIIYLTETNPIHGLDLTPASIVLSGILAAYAIFYYRFLDLVPLAYKTLFETQSDGIIALDDQNRIQDINSAAMSFLGIHDKKIIGIKAELSGATSEALLKAVIDRETYDQIEITVNQQIRTFSIIKQELRNYKGNWLVVLRDITRLKIAMNDLYESEIKYRELVENSPDAIAIYIEGKIVFVNNECLHLMAASSSAELIGKHVIQFVHPDSRLVVSERMKKSAVEGKVLPLAEEKFLRLDGTSVDVEVKAIPIRFMNKAAVQLIVSDITERKKAEEIINLKNLELQKLIAEKDKFFSIIAHDLKSPFSGLLGVTQMMKDQLPNFTPAEIMNIVEKLNFSANNVYSLIENLLEWSILQRGITVFAPKTITLLPKFDKYLDSIMESARTKGILISMDIPASLNVYADENMLASIFRNLTTNAIKFTAKGGKIAIQAKYLSDQAVEISFHDSGIGMSSELIEKLFHLDENTSRKGTDGEASTGLGLIICKDFIDKHSGSIRVESEIGKGSVFYCVLPGIFPLN